MADMTFIDFTNTDIPIGLLRLRNNNLKRKVLLNRLFFDEYGHIFRSFGIYYHQGGD